MEDLKYGIMPGRAALCKVWFMIDTDGFRHGIGIMLLNDERQLFLGKRIARAAWQFPQGGIKAGETPEQAMFRELHEEVGLQAEDVRILSCTREWLSYRLPSRLIRRYARPVCIGQKQKWFLLQFVGEDDHIDLAATSDPEFDAWLWVSYWYPMARVVSFKRHVYGEALREFAPLVLPDAFRSPRGT